MLPALVKVPETVTPVAQILLPLPAAIAPKPGPAVLLMLPPITRPKAGPPVVSAIKLVKPAPVLSMMMLAPEIVPEDCVTEPPMP